MQNVYNMHYNTVTVVIRSSRLIIGTRFIYKKYSDSMLKFIAKSTYIFRNIDTIIRLDACGTLVRVLYPL